MKKENKIQRKTKNKFQFNKLTMCQTMFICFFLLYKDYKILIIFDFLRYLLGFTKHEIIIFFLSLMPLDFTKPDIFIYIYKYIFLIFFGFLTEQKRINKEAAQAP